MPASTSWSTTATHVLILVAVGLAFEVVFTAIGEYRRTRNRRLMGYSYLWMIPIYAAVYPALTVLYGRVGHWPALGRGFFYAVVILAVEYVSGWILRKLTGECPWERGYYGSKWGIHGLIRLDYTPTWMLAGLLYERIYLVLRGLA